MVHQTADNYVTETCCSCIAVQFSLTFASNSISAVNSASLTRCALPDDTGNSIILWLLAAAFIVGFSIVSTARP